MNQKQKGQVLRLRQHARLLQKNLLRGKGTYQKKFTKKRHLQPRMLLVLLKIGKHFYQIKNAKWSKISIDIDFEEFFTSDVKRDKHIVQMFSAIGYKLDNFFNLRDQYDGSQLKTNRKSELKLKLSKVDESLRQVKCDAASVCNISKDIANL